MTERELIQQQQELGDSRFLVTRSGKFFSAYGCGAFALARATGYRVMHRQRKGGNFVLTTGFPESHVGKVMEQIIAAGGKIDRQDDGSFVFSGIDGSEAEALVSIPEKTEGGQDRKGSKSSYDNSLQAMILSFDLSRSTPMDAMNFIDLLQKRIYDTDVVIYEQKHTPAS